MPSLRAVGGSWSETAGGAPASSIGTTVTGDASGSVKGTAVELIASTAHDAHWLSVTIVIGATSSTATAGMLDILIGAATEAVLIADLPVHGRGPNEGGGGPYLFPCFIPRGSRLAAKYAGASASNTVEVIIHLFSGDPLGPYAGCAYVDHIGAVTSGVFGVNLDPGATPDTYTAWTEMVASTVRPVRWLVMAVQNIDIAFVAATQWTIQVGIGAATEQQIGGDFLLTTGVTFDNNFPFAHFYLPVFVPAGSRLVVRAKCNIATDGDRDLYVSLFGAG